jgi:FMN phosphatase YigB (HAD superfamily)
MNVLLQAWLANVFYEADPAAPRMPSARFQLFVEERMHTRASHNDADTFRAVRHLSLYYHHYYQCFQMFVEERMHTRASHNDADTFLAVRHLSLYYYYYTRDRDKTPSGR